MIRYGDLRRSITYVDLQIIMKPLQTAGVTDAGDAKVHTGFLGAWNLVASEVLGLVRSQLSTNPGYAVVVTGAYTFRERKSGTFLNTCKCPGHSLGGSIAAVASLALQAQHPGTPLKLYTFGQPRTGNGAFASLVESRIGTNNIFRGKCIAVVSEWCHRC